MSSQGNAMKRRRTAQGFELNPARCCNCQRFQPAKWGRTATGKREAEPYEQPRCGLGGFIVKSSSICDQWLGVDGATVEQPNPPGDRQPAA